MDNSELVKKFKALPDLLVLAGHYYYHSRTNFTLSTDTWPIPTVMEMLADYFEEKKWAYKERLTLLDVGDDASKICFRLVDVSQSARFDIQLSEIEDVEHHGKAFSGKLEKFLKNASIINPKDPKVDEEIIKLFSK